MLSLPSGSIALPFSIVALIYAIQSTLYPSVSIFVQFPPSVAYLKPHFYNVNKDIARRICTSSFCSDRTLERREVVLSAWLRECLQPVVTCSFDVALFKHPA